MSEFKRKNVSPSPRPKLTLDDLSNRLSNAIKFEGDTLTIEHAKYINTRDELVAAAVNAGYSELHAANPETFIVFG